MASGLKNILVIEDEEFILQLLVKTVKNEGHFVFSGQEFDDAVKILSKEKIDLVITDLNIPGVKENSVCRFMKSDEKLKNIPVVLISGASSTALKEEEVLVNAVLQKPFDLKNLCEIIRSLLSDRQESA